MRKIYCIMMLLLFCCLSSGCGRGETSEYYDIQSESEPFFDVADSEVMHGHFLGAQFYQEEPVQLWAFRTAPGSEKADVFLYRMDKSKELLFEDLPEELFFGARSYLDSQGNLYHFYNITIDINHSIKVLMKMDPSGELLYRHEDEGSISIRDICQLRDGRIFLYYSGSNGSGYVLGELNQDTGIISDVTSFIYEPTMWMGSGGEELLCLHSDGICEVSTKNGGTTVIWPFIGTTYQTPQLLWLWDFIITEEGTIQLLRGSFSNKSEIFLETLHKVNVEDGKIPIVMRGAEFAGGDGRWFKDMAALFNQENEHYYIVLEECGLHGDWDDYARQTSVEVGAGKGPDIFYGNVLREYAYGVASKGGFADLSPYLEDAGIREADYFPCAFGCWKDEGKVYSVTTNISFLLPGGGYYIDSTVIGGTKEPDIETLVDALLSWQENAVYMDNVSALGVLEMLLEGSEDLWGMVDWNTGTCNFNTELFAKILQAAKQYGYDPRNRFPSLVQREFYFLYTYMDSAIREEEGKVMAGTLFDDGYHAKAGSGYTLAVNANSAQKEGAWEFIRFLLGEEAQACSFGDSGIYPVNRNAFHALIEKEQAEGRIITDAVGRVTRIKGFYDLTDSRVKELEEILEEARFLPVKTTPILEIIYDEAQDYFDGIKSIDEICVLINNRVQLYLDEIR